MSGFSGRRAPNFAQYLEDLNTIPSQYDQSVQQQQADSFNIDAELALFTNTEFLDFGHFGDMNMPLGYSPAEEEHKAHEEKINNGAEKNNDMDYIDLLNDLNNISDYSANFTSDQTQDIQANSSTFHSVPSAQDSKNVSGQQQQFKEANEPLPKAELSPTNGISSFVSSPIQVAGTKRKQTLDAKSPDESARMAAEEDKRRRNTAASARFRVKKKQREQALERSVKEASEKNAVLEARVSQLELENQWLKNLITEKNGSESGEGKQRSETDIAHMFKKFLANHKAGNGQSVESKIGVGTA